MTLRWLIGKLHLWLGLASGIVVFVVAVTGCLYVFEKEIQDLAFRDVRFVEVPEAAAPVPPSAVFAAARDTLGTGHSTLLYHDYTASRPASLLAPDGTIRSHQVWAFRDDVWQSAYVHPYTGEVLKVWTFNGSFFERVEALHAHLWLPEEIGRPIVGASTLIFVVLLATGLWLWFPLRPRKAFATERGRRPLFKVTWTRGTKRLNYDLHNVVGFYATGLMLIVALTGLVWSYSWMETGVYWLASGGELPEEPALVQSTLPEQPALSAEAPVIDQIWGRVRRAHPGMGKYGWYAPPDARAPFDVVLDPDDTNYSGASTLQFDQYSGALLRTEDFATMNRGAQLRQMNYDIHAGVIWGFPTKVLAFFASLIAASLPVTGVIIWWPRWRRKQRRKRAQVATPAPPGGDGAAAAAPVAPRVAQEA